MTVSLTVSQSLGGSATADTLAGAGTGVDLGSTVNGQYSPLILQSANTGAKSLFIRHNAAIDPITNVKTYIQTYGVGTGFTYGGASSAAADFTTLANYGDTSATVNANNNDGLGSGLFMDMDWQVSTVNQFAPGRVGTQVVVYGRSGGASGGIATSLATAVSMHVDALLWNNSGTAVDATTPVTGKIGKSGDTVLGDVANPRLRFYLPTAATSGGILQWEWVIAYSYTA